MDRTLTIEVISDVVCPWCFIGKRRLETALAQFRSAHPAAPEPLVHWLPFQLNPDLPATGMDRAAYLARKFGARAADIYSRLTEVGATVGIAFAFDRIRRQPNTVAAHQLIALAGRSGLQEELVERLFRACFEEGKDLTDQGVLVESAQQIGIDEAAARACLGDDGMRQEVLDLGRSAQQMGVSGVPFFIFGRAYGLSGAQPPEVLVRAMEAALDDAGQAVS